MTRAFLLVIFLYVQGLWAMPCVLDLEDGWQRVLSYAPALAAADEQIAIMQAATLQASLAPNPIAALEAENLGVNNPNDDAEPPETTISIAQLIELGGKRYARTALARAEIDLAFWDAQIARRDLRLQFTLAFIETSVAQEKYRLALEEEEVASHALNAVLTQVDGGKVSQLQERKAHLALKTAQMEVRDMASKLSIAKQRLASLWGAECPDFDCVLFNLYDIFSPPCICDLVEELYLIPDISRAEHQILCANQNVSLQQTYRIPDLTLMAGYRTFHDSNQHGWLFGIEMPLPIFNRNQGNIRRAHHEATQAIFQREALIQAFKERLFTIHEIVLSAVEESEWMKNCILTEATETLDLTELGYQKGKLDYFEVLDAKKRLVEIEEKYIDLLHGFHVNKAELERLSAYY
jgi:outer membrane protein, heavy metal efflux system